MIEFTDATVVRYTEKDMEDIRSKYVLLPPNTNVLAHHMKKEFPNLNMVQSFKEYRTEETYVILVPYNYVVLKRLVEVEELEIKYPNVAEGN